MLESITVDAPCFGGRLAFAPWKQVNFIFGPNGSGKTSISRWFAAETDRTGSTARWTHDRPLRIRVFNRDYIDTTLRQTSLPGVFTLDDESRGDRERLDEISRDGGECDKAQTQLDRLRTTLQHKQQEHANARAALEEAAWPLHKDEQLFPRVLLPALQGGRSTKSGHADRLLKASSDKDGVPELADLLREQASLDDTTGVPQDLLALPTLPDIANLPGVALLGKSIVPRQDAPFSDLVERLRAQDWVAQGRHYLAAAAGKCPFCQQGTPSDLARHLEELFDDAYDADIAALPRLRTVRNAATHAYLAQLRALSESEVAAQFADVAALTTATDQLRADWTTDEKSIDAKIASPSQQVTLTDVDEVTARIAVSVETANTLIRDHNRRVAKKSSSRHRLEKRAWSYLANGPAKPALDSYRAGLAARETAIGGLSAKVTEAERTLERLDVEAAQLRDGLYSSGRTIAAINAELANSGFTSFTIAESEDEDGSYCLRREDGELDSNTLSEGERNFIAFLYFLHQLKGTSRAEADHAKILAVIDDPISSLDSDVLHLVTSFVLGLIGDVERGTGPVGQLIMLTHNVQFHHEADYQFTPDRSKRTYRVIRKRASPPNDVQRCDKSPITTTYALLWREVRLAHRDKGAVTLVGLENVLRRILEYYFRTLGGGIWDDKFYKEFEPNQRIVAQALMKWANAGSHVVPDELHYSPSGLTTVVYLETFRKVFATQGHQGHYDMMMAASDD